MNTYHDGAEALFDGDEGAVLDVGKDGGLHVEAGHVALLPAEEQPGPLLHAGLAVLHKLLEVGAVVLRPVLRPPVQRVADHHRLRRGDHALEELVVDGLLDEDPPGGDAVLALVEEGRSQGRPERGPQELTRRGQVPGKVRRPEWRWRHGQL